MMPTNSSILVVGLGNPILGDDGVGWAVAERLSQGPLPPGVEIERLASGGIGLMERLVGYQQAVVIDAISTGRYPIGSVHVFALEELENPDAGHLGSAHETNLRTALELGRGLGVVLPEKVSVVAMLEIAMWVAIPYLLVGIVWAFLNADDVARVENRLETRIPAGSDLAAFGTTTALWPFLLFGHEVCAP